MTQISQPWDGTTVGDAATRAPYSETEWDDMFEGMFDSDDDRGVLEDRGLELVGSVPAANRFRIAPGEALVKGKWYRSDANVNWTVPSSVGAWREDRIVLSCSWAAINLASRDPAVQLAQTIRLVRLINPGEGGGAPASTKTDGVLWEIDLYRIRVTNAGVVTMANDDREFIERGGAVATHDHEGVDSVVLDNDALVDRTRYFFIPAVGKDPIDDDAEWQGYTLEDSAETWVFGWGMIPSDFVSTLKIRAVIIPEASGDAVLYLSTVYSTCAEIWDVYGDGYDPIKQPIAVILNQRNCVMEYQLGAFAAAEQMMHILLIRYGADVADDVDADIYCPGFLISYVADS